MDRKYGDGDGGGEGGEVTALLERLVFATLVVCLLGLAACGDIFVDLTQRSDVHYAGFKMC